VVGEGWPRRYEESHGEVPQLQGKRKGNQMNLLSKLIYILIDKRDDEKDPEWERDNDAKN
jgi:hypothetical protein